MTFKKSLPIMLSEDTHFVIFIGVQITPLRKHFYYRCRLNTNAPWDPDFNHVEFLAVQLGSCVDQNWINCVFATEFVK